MAAAAGRDTAPSGAPTVTRYEAGSSLTGAAVNAPASAPGTHGNLTITTAGVFTYTVAASNNALASGASNTDTFTYEITGGTASRETATLTITVTGVNDAPVQVSPLPAFRTAFRGTMYSFDLNQLATDADNDALTFTLVTATCQGLTISGDNLVGGGAGGTVSATTAEGIVECGVTVSDGTGMVTITSPVRIADRLPELFAADDAESVTEDGATITGNVIDGASGGQDTAPSGTPTVTRYEEGSRLSVSGAAVNAPASAPGAHGRLTITTAGAFTYTVADSNNALAAGRSNTDTFTYEIADGTTSRDMATLTITITGVNDASVARSPLPPIRTASVGTMYELDLNTLVTDADGDDLAFTLVGACDGFAISGDNLVGSGTGGVVPAATTAGDKNCSVRVSDGTGMLTVAFTVPVISPTLMAVNDTASGTEDEATITGNVIDGSSGGRDTAPVGTPTVTRYAAGSSLAGAVNAPASAPGTHGSLTITTAGAFTYTVAASNNALVAGRSNTDTFTYEITGGTTSREMATLTITITGVNDAPMATAEGLRRVADTVGTSGQSYELDLDMVFIDPDGMTLSYSIPSGRCDAIFALVAAAGESQDSLLVGSGAERIIPEGTEKGVKTCAITASNGTLSTTETLRIEVRDDLDRQFVQHAMGGIARTLGWDAVDAIRARASARAPGSGVDLSGLTARLREFAAAESDATEGVRFDGLLPAGNPSVHSAANGVGLATGVAGYGAAGHRGADNDLHMWTSATHSELEFEAEDLTYDSDLDTFRVGVEIQREDMLWGVVVSHSSGDTEFGSGMTDFSQWGITPYAARTWGNTRAWGLAGMGVGTLDYMNGQGVGRRAASSSTESKVLAAGLEHHVSNLAGGMDVIARAEGMVSGLKVEETALYEEMSAWTRGGRGEVEVGLASRSRTGFWRPYVAAAVRWDDGDDESDSAFEYGGGIEGATPNMTVEASLRGDGGGDFDRMSYSLALGYDAGQDARGFTADLTSAYGTARNDPFAQTFRYDDGSARGRDTLKIKLGYGASAWQGLLAPYLETNLDGGSFSAAHLGLAYTRGPASVKLEHGFRPGTGQTRDGHELSLLGEIRF